MREVLISRLVLRKAHTVTSLRTGWLLASAVLPQPTGGHGSRKQCSPTAGVAKAHGITRSGPAEAAPGRTGNPLQNRGSFSC